MTNKNISGFIFYFYSAAIYCFFRSVFALEIALITNVHTANTSSNLIAQIFRRSYAHMEAGKYEKAIAGFNRAIKVDSKYPEPHHNRGLIWTKMGKYKKAIAEYDRAIYLKPGSVKLCLNRGIAYGYKGNIKLDR